MAYVRTTDGTVVKEGAVTSESVAARLWRWPTKFMPNSVIDSPAIVVLPVVFWSVMFWILWKKVLR